MIEWITYGASTIAIIGILVALRCIWIDYWLRKYANTDYRSLRDTNMKFSETVKEFQKALPKSAKKYKRKRKR